MSTPSHFIVLADCRGALTWLGEFPSLKLATDAADQWLASAGRDEEDAAFVLPVLWFGRAPSA